MSESACPPRRSPWQWKLLFCALMQLSIVIPIHNEEPSILPLYDRLTIVLEKR